MGSIETLPEKQCLNRKKNSKTVKMDREYQLKRQRNNEAVKRSREKARQKNQEIHENIQKLRSDNRNLEFKRETLKKELELYKELFRKHCNSNLDSNEVTIQEVDLTTLLMGTSE